MPRKTRIEYDGAVYHVINRGNHYHLVIQPPNGNLVSGMQWMQSKFANRFNKFVKGLGHVFQGRYKALLIEAGSLLRVVNYVEAGV